MEIKGTSSVGSSSRGNCNRKWQEDNGKYVCYTAEQVETLEKLYTECPNPSLSQRLEMIYENPILSNLESKQIKVWYQNCRRREKQRKVAIELQSVNKKLAATKKLLLLENDRLQKELCQLVNENEYIRQLLQNVSAATTDTSCESAVNSPQYPSKAADNSTGVFLLAEETTKEFLSKATGSTVDSFPIPRMKLCSGVEGIAVRACSELSFGLIDEMLRDDAMLLSFVLKKAISPFGPYPAVGLKLRSNLGGELLRWDCKGCESVLKWLRYHQDAIVSCSFKSNPVCLVANLAGLDMQETILVVLQGIELDQIFKEPCQGALNSVVPAIMQQGVAVLLGGICKLLMGHHESYEQAAWKVLAEGSDVGGLAVAFIN